MALDTDRGWPPTGDRLTVRLANHWRSLIAWASHLEMPAALSGAWAWLQTTRLFRFVTGSLARRIFVSNLLGLAVLLGGILWVSQHNALLINAKRDSLRIQGEIVAAAIAANATIGVDGIRFDPDRLPEVEGQRLPFRDDGFAALELSLRPDRVGPVLRRLIQPNHNTRARIYDREGDLIVDTDGSGLRSSRPPSDDGKGRVRVKTPWSRIVAWFDGSDLPVYNEIGAANGTYYQEVRQALRGSAPLPMLLLTGDGEQIVSLALPIQRRNATLGALLLSTRPGEIDRILDRERWIILSLATMALLTTLMASAMLARTIAGPMRRLSEAADHVSQSISARAELPDYADRRDEVGLMSGAFRRMTAALYRRIQASEKFAADVAHELKNPLTAARATAESLSYARTSEQREELVEQIQGELKRLNRLITDVSNASRLDAELARQTTTPVDLADVLKGTVDVFRDLSAADGRHVVFEAAPVPRDLIVKGHEGRLGQVVTNLIDNALSFSAENDTVIVKARRIGGDVEFSVEDEGPGMPDDKLEAIFERFYSDRPESDSTRGKNSGLGLSISREIVAAHGGRIWAENRRKDGVSDGSIAGARFIVRLPAAGAGATRGTARAAE